jgi:hypothetical protein
MQHDPKQCILYSVVQRTAGTHGPDTAYWTITDGTFLQYDIQITCIGTSEAMHWKAHIAPLPYVYHIHLGS